MGTISKSALPFYSLLNVARPSLEHYIITSWTNQRRSLGNQAPNWGFFQPQHEVISAMSVADALEEGVAIYVARLF